MAYGQNAPSCDPLKGESYGMRNVQIFFQIILNYR